MRHHVTVGIILVASLFAGAQTTQLSPQQQADADRIGRAIQRFRSVANYMGSEAEQKRAVANLMELSKPYPRLAERVRQLVAPEEKAAADNMRAFEIAKRSPSDLREVVRQFENQREQLLLSQAGDNAKLAYLEGAVQDMRTTAKVAVATDPVSAELQKAAEARTKVLKLLEQGSKIGANTPTEIADAEAELAETQAKLALRQEQVAQMHGAQAVTLIEADVRNLLAARAQRQVELDFIHHRIDDLQRADDMASLANQEWIQADGLCDALVYPGGQLTQNALDLLTQPATAPSGQKP